MEIKIQKTPRDGAEHGEEKVDVKGMGGENNTTPTTWYQQGKGRQSRPEGGRAGVRMIESVRGIKVPLDRITPGSDRDLGAGQ